MMSVLKIFLCILVGLFFSALLTALQINCDALILWFGSATFSVLLSTTIFISLPVCLFESDSFFWKKRFFVAYGILSVVLSIACCCIYLIAFWFIPILIVVYGIVVLFVFRRYLISSIDRLERFKRSLYLILLMLFLVCSGMHGYRVFNDSGFKIWSLYPNVRVDMSYIYSPNPYPNEIYLDYITPWKMVTDGQTIVSVVIDCENSNFTFNDILNEPLQVTVLNAVVSDFPEVRGNTIDDWRMYFVDCNLGSFDATTLHYLSDQSKSTNRKGYMGIVGEFFEYKEGTPYIESAGMAQEVNEAKVFNPNYAIESY
jgi:hypothetical protein